MVDTALHAGIEPRGPKPKKTFSRGNIFLYGTLILVRNPLGQCIWAPSRDHIPAVGQSMGRSLHGHQLRWAVAGVLEFGSNPDPFYSFVDRDCLCERLRLVELEVQRV